jgi:hypothetical protein
MRTLITLLYHLAACGIVLTLILVCVTVILWVIDPATLFMLLHQWRVARGV